MSEQKVLNQACILLFAVRFGAMIVEDVLGNPPAWHWIGDACGIVALAFCWWTLMGGIGHRVHSPAR